MGLSKDLKRMTAAIKAKLGGGKSADKGKKGFNMFHFLLVLFSGVFIGYLVYHKLKKHVKGT